MQRLVIAGLAVGIALCAWWLLSGSGESAQQHADAGASSASQASADLFAPRAAAGRAAARDAGASDGADGTGPRTAGASGDAGSDDAHDTDPRERERDAADERLRGSSGGGSRASSAPDEALPIETEEVDEEQEVDEEEEPDPVDVAELEAEAAEIAERLRLVDEPTLERRVDRLMESDPGLSETEARNRVLADELLWLHWMRERFPDLTDEQRRARSVPGDPARSLSPEQRIVKLAEANEAFSSS